MSLRPISARLLAAALWAASGVACSRPAATAAPITVAATAQSSGTTQLLIAVHAVDDSVVWASGARGTVIRTTDGGAHWTAMRVPGADSLQFRDVHAVDARTAWVLSIGNGAMSRIYRTDDGGTTWTRQFTNPDPNAFYDCLEFWDARRGLAIGDAIGTEMAVLRTDDGGAHWTRIAPSSLPRAQANEGSFAASGTCIAMHGSGRAWIVMNSPAASRLIRTVDFGRTWALETLPITTREGSGTQSVIFRDARHGMVLGGGYQVRQGRHAHRGDGGRRRHLGPAQRPGIQGRDLGRQLGPRGADPDGGGGRSERERVDARRRADVGRDRHAQLLVGRLLLAPHRLGGRHAGSRHAPRRLVSVSRAEARSSSSRPHMISQRASTSSSARA
jgi:photosystem II stability/assembly factor-like uncharacterized protein